MSAIRSLSARVLSPGTTLLALALTLGLTSSLHAQNCPAGASAVISQPVDYANGFKSDATPNAQVLAESVLLAQDTALNSLTVVGGFGNNSVTNNFTLLVHADSAGSPGAVLYMESGIAASLFPTGSVLPPPFIPVNEYQITLTPASPFTMPAGTVWIQIYNDSAGGGPFYWLTGTMDAASGSFGARIAFTAPGVSFSLLGLDLTLTICGSAPSPATLFCFGDGTDVVCPCGNLGGSGEGCANSTAGGATLAVSGTDSVAANDLVLASTGNPPSTPGLFFQGTGLVNGGLGGFFGDGVRCVGGSLERFPVVVTDGSGGATTAYSLLTMNQAMPGDTRYYQFWYRDPIAGPCSTGFNVSTAAAVTWTP